MVLFPLIRRVCSVEDSWCRALTFSLLYSQRPSPPWNKLGCEDFMIWGITKMPRTLACLVPYRQFIPGNCAVISIFVHGVSRSCIIIYCQLIEIDSGLFGLISTNAVQSMIRARGRIHNGLEIIVFFKYISLSSLSRICSQALNTHGKISHYNRYTELFENIEYIKCLSGIFCRMCLAWNMGWCIYIYYIYTYVYAVLHAKYGTLCYHRHQSTPLLSGDI